MPIDYQTSNDGFPIHDPKDLLHGMMGSDLPAIVRLDPHLPEEERSKELFMLVYQETAGAFYIYGKKDHLAGLEIDCRCPVEVIATPTKLIQYFLYESVFDELMDYLRPSK